MSLYGVLLFHHPIMNLLTPCNPASLSYEFSGALVNLETSRIYQFYMYPYYVSAVFPTYSISPEYAPCAGIEPYLC